MSFLEGKTVVLTGASGGIGLPLAEALSDAGARLLLVGRNKVALEKLARRLGARHRVIEADLCDRHGLHNLAQACRSEAVIDILINNAGINEFSFLENQSIDTIERIVCTNLLAPMYTCKLLLPRMKKQVSACIVNVGSSFGSIGFPGHTSYCASKFGLRGFTEALRRELSDSAVVVHYVSPRAVKTAMNTEAVDAMNHALGNAADDPQVVVGAVMKTLRSDKGQDIYLGWPERLFVKLNAILPSVVSSAIAKQLNTIRQYALPGA